MLYSLLTSLNSFLAQFWEHPKVIISESLYLASCGLPRLFHPHQGKFIKGLPGKDVSGLCNVDADSLLPSLPWSLFPRSHNWPQGCTYSPCLQPGPPYVYVASGRCARAEARMQVLKINLGREGQRFPAAGLEN